MIYKVAENKSAANRISVLILLIISMVRDYLNIYHKFMYPLYILLKSPHYSRGETGFQSQRILEANN